MKTKEYIKGIATGVALSLAVGAGGYLGYRSQYDLSLIHIFCVHSRHSIRFRSSAWKRQKALMKTLAHGVLRLDLLLPVR